MMTEHGYRGGYVNIICLGRMDRVHKVLCKYRAKTIKCWLIVLYRVSDDLFIRAIVHKACAVSHTRTLPRRADDGGKCHRHGKINPSGFARSVFLHNFDMGMALCHHV